MSFEIKCLCQNCSGHIAFPNDAAGRAVECPHCGMETLLYVPPPTEQAEVAETTKKRNKTAWVLAAVLGIVASIAIYYGRPGTRPDGEQATNALPPDKAESKPLPTPKTDEQKIEALKAKPLLMSEEEKTSRDNILKALLDVSSATALGVNHSKYGDLLTKAFSTLQFEKTKLPTERHAKYLVCAVKAIGYYAEAHKEWSGYLDSEWMMKQNRLLMTRGTFDDFRQNGVPVDLSQYWTIETSKDVFKVPFNEGISLYWQAAGIYIEKMKKDVER